MAPWIESHDDIWEHRKFLRLLRLIRPSLSREMPEPHVEALLVGQLTSLWHFTLRNAWKNADLADWGDATIERKARWEGKPGVFVDALRKSGFLDKSKIHGWLERAGRLVIDRLKNERKREQAVERINGKGKRGNGARV